MRSVSVYAEFDNPPVFLRVINRPLAKVRVWGWVQNCRQKRWEGRS